MNNDPVKTMTDTIRTIAERLTYCKWCGGLSDFCAMDRGCCNECSHLQAQDSELRECATELLRLFDSGEMGRITRGKACNCKAHRAWSKLRALLTPNNNETR